MRSELAETDLEFRVRACARQPERPAAPNSGSQPCLRKFYRWDLQPARKDSHRHLDSHGRTRSADRLMATLRHVLAIAIDPIDAKARRVQNLSLPGLIHACHGARN